MKIQQQKNKTYTITLSKYIVEALQWQKGDVINATIEGNRMVLTKLDLPKKDEIPLLPSA